MSHLASYETSQPSGPKKLTLTSRFENFYFSVPIKSGLCSGFLWVAKPSRKWLDSTTISKKNKIANHIAELDEGVLSRLWSVKGFGQAWHWLREKKRAECTPLNAYLTYVTLPWTSILSGNPPNTSNINIISFRSSQRQSQTSHPKFRIRHRTSRLPQSYLVFPDPAISLGFIHSGFRSIPSVYIVIDIVNNVLLVLLSLYVHLIDLVWPLLIIYCVMSSHAFE